MQRGGGGRGISWAKPLCAAAVFALAVAFTWALLGAGVPAGADAASVPVALAWETSAAPAPSPSLAATLSPVPSTSASPSASPSPTPSASTSPTPTGTPTPTASPTSTAPASPTPVAPAPAAAAALSAATASLALDSFNNRFYFESGGNGYYRNSTAGGTADFWKSAEMIEMVADAYGTSGRATYKHVATALLNGTVARNGSNWLYYTHAAGQPPDLSDPRLNDDVGWMVLAALRVYQMTGSSSYLHLAQSNFDAIWARGWTKEFGGGLWWGVDHYQKNACTNAPAVIAACKLYANLHDPAYLTKAKTGYRWLRKNLYNTSTGQVYDHLSRGSSGPVLNTTSWTYNQGTFIGAANRLYALTKDRTYYDDALRALTYAKNHLTTNGILKQESDGGDGDSGGFKGIFARWALRFTRDNHITSFNAWFTKNAATAWSNRNSRGLMSENWDHPTSNSGTLYSWDCTSGVVMMQALTPHS